MDVESTRDDVARRSNIKRLLALFLMLLIVSVVQGMLFARSSPDRSVYFSLFYVDNSAYYHTYASHLVGGQLFNNGLSYYPPLPAFLLSLTYRMGMDKPSTAKGTYIFLGVCTTLLTFVLGCILFSDSIGFWGGILWSASFGGLVLSTGVNAELPFLLLLLTAIIVGARLARSPRPRVSCICIGILCGLMALTRHEGLWIAAPFAFYALLCSRGGLRRAFLNATLILLAAIFTVAPWTVRCYSIMKVYRDYGLGASMGWSPRLGPVTVTTPLFFALANNEKADGGYTYSLVKNKMAGGASFLSDFKIRELMMHGYREGLSFIGRSPGPFVTELIGRKIARAGKGLSLGFFASNYPFGVSGVRPAYDFFVPNDTRSIYLVLVLFALGLCALLAEKERSILLLAVFAYYLLFTALFAGQTSTGVMLLPLVYLVVVKGIAWLFSFVPKRYRRPKAGKLLLGLLLVLSLIGGYVEHAKERVFRFEGTIDPATGRMLQHMPLSISGESVQSD